MARHFGTTSFFVGVGLGDAAIHILWSDSAQNNNKIVERAIMVDGGALRNPFSLRNKEPHESIYTTVKDIEENFICQGGPGGGHGVNPQHNLLLFDAFIVTHWDHDHYQGVMQFLANDLDASVARGVNRLSRARYLNNQPLSTFHAPQWHTCFRLNADCTFPWFMFDFKTVDDQQGQMHPTTTLSIRVGLNWFDDMLRMRVGKDHLLGRNLFARDDPGPTEVQRQACRSLAELMALYVGLNEYPDVANQNRNVPWPGFYCVAVNMEVLGGTQANFIATGDHITATNMSSICCLLAWHNTNPTYVSLYTSGDAHGYLEEKIAEWMGYTNNDNNSVTIAKLSHHGSASSTPPKLLPTLKPKYIVTMSGNNSKHAHPRWEVLHDLYAWYLYGDSTLYAAPKAVHLLRCPSYISSITPGQRGYFEADKFKPNVDDAEDVWDRMWAQHKKMKTQLGLTGRQSRPLLPTYVREIGDALVTHNADDVWWNKAFLLKIIGASLTGDIFPALIYGWSRLIREGFKDYVAFTIVGSENDPRNKFESRYTTAGEVVRNQTAEWRRYTRPALPAGPGIWPLHTLVDSNHNSEEYSVTQPKLPTRHLSKASVSSSSSSSSWDWVTGERDSSSNIDQEVHIDPPSVHYIVPDGEVSSELPSDPSTYTKLPRTNLFHRFLRLISAARFDLIRRPDVASSPGSTAGSVRVSMAPTDSWQWWIQSIILVGIAEQPSTRAPSPVSMFVEASSWPPSTTTTLNFDISITVELQGGFKVSMSIDTRTAINALGVTQATIDAMVSEMSILPMGISMTITPASWTLGKVAELIQFPHSKAITLLQRLPLTPVNPSASARSALWYSTGTSQFTTFRLEWIMQDDAKSVFSEWLNASKLELQIKRVGVVARRSVYDSYRPPQLDKKQANSSGISRLLESNERLNNKSQVVASGEIMFDISVDVNHFDFNLYITISDESVTFRLQRDTPNPGESEFAQLLRWAARALGSKEDPGGGSDEEKYKRSTWSSCEAWVNAATELLGAVRPRVVEFTLAYDENGKLQGLGNASITLQVELATEKSGGDPKNKVVFFITFGWSKTKGASLNGELWSKPRMAVKTDYQAALPFWEKHVQLSPSDPDATIDHVDIKKLLGIDSLPAGVPTEITSAKISVDREGLTFHGSIACSYDDKKPSQMLTLDELEVSIRRTWENKATQTPASWDAGLGITLFLFPLGRKPSSEASISADPVPSGQAELPCIMTGSIRYSSGGKPKAIAANRADSQSSWELTASVDGLKVCHLAQFWPEGEIRDAAMTMLSHIYLEHLGLTYHFGAGDGDGGTDFKIDGALVIGGLRLGLDFHCNSTDGWEFGAKLLVKPASTAVDDAGSATIETILQELLGKDNVPDIPGEVLKVPVSRPGSDGEVLSFKCVLVKDKGDPGKGVQARDILVSTISIHISAISLNMVQWRDTAWAKDVPSKRVVKVALNEVGPVTAPLVGKLKQPFEQLVYMWVSDKASAKIKPKPLAEKGAKSVGITKAEFDILNPRLLDTDKLYFQAGAADPAKTLPTEFVIEAGSHFLVIAKNAQGTPVAVLDYVFGRPKNVASSLLSDGSQPVLLLEDPETPSKDPAKAPFKKSAGPVMIENVGLTYDIKEKRLGIVLDATFLLGPIGLALLGFGVSVKLAKATNSKRVKADTLLAQSAIDAAMIGSLPVSDPQVTLDGLMVSFERPPLTIAGGFARTKLDGATYYAGGLIVGFVPWKLMAMGVYGEVPKKPSVVAQRRLHHRSRSSVFDVIELADTDDIAKLDEIEFRNDEEIETAGETFTMVFVILKLEGPLFSVGFADISGLTAGVGVNSSMRLPTAETVLEFPFTKPSGTPDPSQGPLAALKAVMFPPSGQVPWFTPREGSFWVAAGLKLTAMTMIAADVVLVITTSPSVQIGIFGVAVIDLPSLTVPLKFAHAELGIACVFDPAAGTFRFDAQLSPRSYVLHESCHLTGGLALYSWAKTGDFVFTIGGYHQAYVRPEGYPNPPRLRIAWSLSDKLRISGEAYFAITARMCMGGGKLNASLNAGPLLAWFDAFVDFLINFRPFKFAGDGGLAVGIQFTLDLWLVTIRISCEIKAYLSVLGPPMAGRVHVDFWVFGFDIDFGDRDRALRESQLNMLELKDFKELILKGAATKTSGIPMPMDWVDVSEPGQNPLDDKKKNDSTNAPFTFNCSAGLLPENNDDPKKPEQGFDNKKTSWMSAMFDDIIEIPDNTWAVKAGELQFAITLAFAAGVADVFDNRPTRRTPNWTVPIEAKQKELYALPMRLIEPLESTVRVDINQKSDHVMHFHSLMKDEERSEDRWLVKPVVQNVPKNFWAQYDSGADPALMGNAVASLLNAPRATGSVPLVMGLTFQPPLPFLSKDKVPKFNIVTDMLQRVNKDGYPFKEVDSVTNGAWKPIDRGDNKLEWKRVMNLWDTEASEKRAADVVRLWANRLGWNTQKGPLLTGARPQALLNRFEDMVPAAPRISVGFK